MYIYMCICVYVYDQVLCLEDGSRNRRIKKQLKKISLEGT